LVYDSLFELDLIEVYDKCEKLRLALGALPIDVVGAQRWLSVVATLLSAGERFCIKA